MLKFPKFSNETLHTEPLQNLYQTSSEPVTNLFFLIRFELSRFYWPKAWLIRQVIDPSVDKIDTYWLLAGLMIHKQQLIFILK